ncbi:MAG: diguanylate cyclase [Pseudomonadota bacterium]
MEQELPRNFLKTDSENTIKNTVLASLMNPAPGEDLMDRLNFLVRQEGETACKVILELLIHRNFGHKEAVQYWQGIVDHHRTISTSLGRPVSLSVTVCDYFSLHDMGVNLPKLIDVHEFEAMHIERQFDFLTGLHNKQTLENALNQEFIRAERHHRKLSVLFLDLDSFKEINDRHGHLTGDKMLQHVGRILTQNKRSVDIAARFGGDEFVMLLPDTDKKEALNLAERIRTEINKEIIVVENKEVLLTVSGGIATYPDDALSGKGLFKCADNALYQAKHLGKNIVLLHEPEKRRSKRVDIMAPLTITQIDAEPFKLAPIQSKNLGCNGILLESSVPINRGSLLELEITLDDTKLTIQGEVVRMEKVGKERFDIGVSFLMTQGTANSMLRDYLQ